MLKNAVEEKNATLALKQPVNFWAALLLVCALFLAMPAVGFTANYITADEAKKIALTNAGAPESDVTIVKLTRYDKRFGVIYDIEFITSEARYTYEIDAVSGEIVAQYMKDIGKVKIDKVAPTPEAINQANVGDYISAERAKAIAFEHAQIQPQNVTAYESKLKQKRGVTIYDIEFKHSRMEYEYAINAATGEIISWEYERD